MYRRWSLALALSALLHTAAVGGVLTFGFLRGTVSGPIDLEITGMRAGDVKDLPLGPPPGGEHPKPARHRPRARHRAEATAEQSGELAARKSAEQPEPGVEEDQSALDDEEAAPARASDLRQYGPEGSRLTVLLRLDRLKATPYAAAVDGLLMRLPDRRDLLDGTGLDLYEGFDALLIATPNLRDYAVTFLAARHRLTDANLRAALDRGARATGRVMVWRTEGRRPFAERHARIPSAVPSRDDRLIVLPAPGLVVVTPPLYRSLLLGPARRAPAAGDGGAEGAGGGGGGDGAETGDGGAVSAGGAPAPAPAPSWRALLRRIDAEDGLLPPKGIAMVSAVDIFKAAATGTTPILFGMEVPRAITAVLGVDGSPFLDVTAEFASEAEAGHWEAEWPALQRKLRVNPYLVLTGFVPLLARVTLTRDGSAMRLHETATADETVRLLELVARALGGG
jgi:hypothetical protein